MKQLVKSDFYILSHWTLYKFKLRSLDWKCQQREALTNMCYSILPLAQHVTLFIDLITMAQLKSAKENHLIHHLSWCGKGYRYIQKRILEHGFSRPLSSIGNVLNNNGKQRQAILDGRKYVCKSAPKVLKKSVLNKIKKQYSKDNSPSFREASSKLKVSKSSINRALLVNLNMNKAFKTKSII